MIIYTQEQSRDEAESFGEKSTSKPISNQLNHSIPQPTIILNHIIHLMRNPRIPCNHHQIILSLQWSSIIYRNLNPKTLSQMRPQHQRIRIAVNPKTSRQSNHRHTRTHLRWGPQLRSPSLHHHLRHLNHSLVNQVPVKIEDVANELHSAVSTCRLRYKELLERLLEVAARVLPWGKDVTVKNILKNAPSVIQYMEMKSMTKFRQRPEFFQDDDMERLVGDCLRTNGFDDIYETEDCSSKYFQVNSSCDYPDTFQISPESLSMVYSNYLDEISLVKATAEIGNKRRKQTTFDFDECSDWWNGKSDLSKKLLLKQMLEKDVGLDVMPPSFDKACLVKGKRREKIKAAKLRIERIMHPVTDINDTNLLQPEKSKKKRKKVLTDIEWEDLII